MSGAFGDLPSEVLLALLPLLPPAELAALSAASRELAQAAEPQWRALFQTAYARSLFALRRQLPSWRQRFGARAVARRTELMVDWGGRGDGAGAAAAAAAAPGAVAPLDAATADVWRVFGWAEDRRGRVATAGRVTFASDYTMQGTATHTRTEAEAGGAAAAAPAAAAAAAAPAVMRAKWQGNLGAFITQCGGKRAWLLGWREKVDGTVGAYEYSGQLLEARRGGRGKFTVAGRFSWFGSTRGIFELSFERTAQRAAPAMGGAGDDDAVTIRIRSLFAAMHPVDS